METNSVYSNTRIITQPEFILPENLLLDQPQQMDGIEFLRSVKDNTIPVVFFDPQYRAILDKLSYGNEGHRQKKRSLLPQMTAETIADFHSEIERVLIPMGHLMFWVDKYMLVSGGFGGIGSLKAVDLITWNKGKIGMGYRTRRCAEHLLVFQKPPMRAKGVWQVHSIPDVWMERADKSHPHAKPIGLMERLVKAVSNPGDIVVDPAAGGYNTMRAAHTAGRRFLGCDLV